MASPFSRTTRALALETSRPSLVVLGLAAALLTAWMAWFLFGQVTVYEVSRRARLEAAVTARDVSPVEPGRLVSSQLQIGRRVRTGDVLVELDATAERLRLAEETARLESLPQKIAAARAQADALQRGLAANRESADAAVRSAQAREREAAAGAEFAAEKERRIAKLQASGVLGDIEAYRYSTEAKKARSAHDALQAEAEKLTFDARLSQRQAEAQSDGLRQSIVAMEGDLVATQATVARLRAEIEARQVRAPADGVIGEVQPLAAGAYVAAGEKLATIVPDGRLTIVAEFSPASALGRLRPGQSARLRLDGYPWAQYGAVDARVVRVAGESRDGLLRADLIATPAAATRAPLRHGMAGAAEVAVERVSPAVLVLRASGQMLAPQAAQ